MATKSDTERRIIGLGPVIYTDLMQQHFFEDLIAALEAIPSLHIIIKPKRDIAEKAHMTSDSMMRLIDADDSFAWRNRVSLLPHNIDPYIPVALSDCCIGMPFTSPVLVGLSSGRKGIYYDPLGRATGFRPQRMEALVIRNKQTLIDRVATWANQSGMTEEHKKADEYLPIGDPGERFAAMLQDDSYV